MFEWAAIEPDPFLHGMDAVPLVWEVRFQGGLAAPSCSPGFLAVPPSVADRICLDDDGGVIAVLDYFTGAFIGWSH